MVYPTFDHPRMVREACQEMFSCPVEVERSPYSSDTYWVNLNSDYREHQVEFQVEWYAHQQRWATEFGNSEERACRSSNTDLRMSIKTAFENYWDAFSERARLAEEARHILGGVNYCGDSYQVPDDDDA